MCTSSFVMVLKSSTGQKVNGCRMVRDSRTLAVLDRLIIYQSDSSLIYHMAPIKSRWSTIYYNNYYTQLHGIRIRTNNHNNSGVNRLSIGQYRKVYILLQDTTKPWITRLINLQWRSCWWWSKGSEWYWHSNPGRPSSWSPSVSGSGHRTLYMRYARSG